jgi:predicted Zn-dependent protease
MMRKDRMRSAWGVLSFFAVLFVVSCSSVALTGRKQLNLVPDDQMLATSTDQYSQFMKENKVSTDAAQTARIKRVGARIQAAVEQYARDNNKTKDLAGYAWEFNLVESKEVNAWCMPGGKVVFYTGIMPICQDDDGVAVVMGHEVAHAVAKHGAERMSENLVVQGGGAALSAALASKPAQTQQLWMSAFGAGAQYGVMMPFERGQESEADHLGLIFMAMAGYDPNHSVAFWQRMAAGSAKAEKPPEFMSTHPSDEHRIQKIQQELPEALKYYKKKS